MQRKKLLAASIAAAIAPMTAQAVDVSVSGHVNRMIRYVDDGQDSDIQHLDHAGAGISRWRMSAEGELDNGLMAGAYIESGFGSNANTRTAMNDGGKNEEKHKATTTVTEDEAGVHTATTTVRQIPMTTPESATRTSGSVGTSASSRSATPAQPAAARCGHRTTAPSWEQSTSSVDASSTVMFAHLQR